MAGKGGGGAWKVAYADFVTAMMALFLVLWLTAQSPQVKQAVARAFTNPFASPDPPRTGMLPASEDPAGEESRKGDHSAAAAIELTVLKRLSQQMIEALNSSHSEDLSTVVQMRFDDDNLRISVFDRPSRAVFEPDSERLTPFGTYVFSTLAWQISQYPAKLMVHLEGHTLASETTGAKDEGPWELSVDRAAAVRRMLLEHQVKPERIRNVTGYGASKPLNRSNPNEEGNRRVSMILKLS